MIETSSIGTSMAVVGQKKSTPFRNPRKSGGSPSGVSEPPTLATRKMKKTIVWTLCRRQALALMIGRISSIAAPVVPIQLASTVPSSRMPVLTAGEPTSLPVSLMPPATVNRDSSRMMNGMYSRRATCSTSNRVSSQPKAMRKGIRKAKAQNADTLPKWWCQNSAASSGNSAIDSRMPTKGTIQTRLSCPPSRCGAPAPAAMATVGNADAAAIDRAAIQRMPIPRDP